MKYLKKNLTWNGNNTVTYFNERLYHFVPEMSNGSLTDIVTNFNVVAMVSAFLITGNVNISIS